MHFRFFSILITLLVHKCAKSEHAADFWKGISLYKECLYKKYPGVCFKEKAVQALNETIMDDRPIYFGILEIQKNPYYFENRTSDDDLPEEEMARSAKLSDILMDKIDQFFKSRIVKVNLSNAVEGRKGGAGGGKKGGMGMMQVAMAMGCMMMNMIMGKMAMMAGSALMIAKLSMLLSLIMLVKKMQEKGGGGEEKHIVYADSGHSHGGGGYGGGGWHRSLEDPHNIIYRGQWTASSDNNGSGL